MGKLRLAARRRTCEVCAGEANVMVYTREGLNEGYRCFPCWWDTADKIVRALLAGWMANRAREGD